MKKGRKFLHLRESIHDISIEERIILADPVFLPMYDVNAVAYEIIYQFRTDKKTTNIADNFTGAYLFD